MARLPPMLLPQLRAAFLVHEGVHDSASVEFAKLAPRVRAIAGGGESKVNAELMALLPALEIISVMGVGYDGIDVEAAKARGIVVTHTPDVLNDDVADLAIGLMLSAARQLPAADRYVRAGHWTQGAMPLAHPNSHGKRHWALRFVGKSVTDSRPLIGGAEYATGLELPYAVNTPLRMRLLSLSAT